MLVIDDILLFPVTGVLNVFRKIHAAAEQEFADQGDAIRTQLSELYMMLETGRITSDEFDSREKELLDRLDALMSREPGTGDASERSSGDSDNVHNNI